MSACLGTTAAGSIVTRNAHDFEQLTGIDARTDSTTTASATSAGLTRSACCACLVQLGGCGWFTRVGLLLA